MSKALTVILCQSATGGEAERALEQQLADALADMPGTTLIAVPPLYDLAPSGAAMQKLKAVAGNLAVLGWLSSRAAWWVLRANGIEGQTGGESVGRVVRCIDLRGRDAAAVLSEIQQFSRRGASFQLASSAPAVPQPEQPLSTTPSAPVEHIDETTLPRWYPVIDHDCCVNCLECLNFCLFGVYGLDDAGKIFVEQPDACRDGCPACARICPAVAILFPSHHDPAIAGDEAPAAVGGTHSEALLSAADIHELARAERQGAIARQAADASHQTGPAAKGDLDRLVDELDGVEL
jgi:NAD-dependent dihydropyrimidine dehydrogenase PreA subunit